MKKTLCIFLALLMLLFASSCSSANGRSENDSQEEETADASGKLTDKASPGQRSMVLPYCEEDVLNPYKAKTQLNIKIGSLIYDGLYKLDEEFKPVEIIAENAEIKDDSVTVSIKETVKFTNSASLNANDIVYSFNQAKQNKRYSELLGGISDAVMIDRFKVRFVLSHPDKYVLNALTFSIIEYGSGENETPVGSGRYYLSGGNLVYNKNHISGIKPKTETVSLCSLKENANYVEALQIGNISFVFNDLSDGEVPRAIAHSTAVTLNNLVYLGINSENEKLDKAVRAAINTAIDKEAIVQQAYHSYAVRTESPFNPEWKETKQKESIFNQAKAVEILEKNGCKYSSEASTCRRNKEGKYLSFGILVPANDSFRVDAANLVAKNLSQVGINAEVIKVGFDKFKERIKDKDFDIYLGEVKLCENMDLSPFFTKSGKTRYGINLKSKITASYSGLLEGSISVSAFEKDFLNECPFVPVCYRRGISFTSNTISDNMKSLSGDVFYNIEEWEISK